MKKTLRILFALAFTVLLFAFGTRIYAEEKTVHTVTQTEQGYAVYVGESADGEPVCVKEALSEVFGTVGRGNIIFLDVITDSFTVPTGEFVISGSVYLESGSVITVPHGAKLVLSSFSLGLSDGTSGAPLIRIKGGEVLAADTFITGDGGGCVLLDYSASSRFTFVSGCIKSSSEIATLSVEQGTAQLSGGSAVNGVGAAVSNKGTLFLGGDVNVGGSKYGVVTDKPISLTSGGKAFSSNADIQYTGTFSEGTLTELFYQSSRDCEKKISLYDKDGKGYPLTFFESSSYTDETDFLAVYLPYKVTVVGGGEMCELLYLRNELVSPPVLPEVNGYLQDGFYLDPEQKVKYDFKSPVTSDLRIYAGYRLAPVSFSVSSLDAVYDGDSHKLEFSRIYHPLADEGTFTYKWFKGEEFISEGRYINVSEVSDSGVYSCILTFHHLSDSVSVTVDEIIVDIAPKQIKVEKPSPSVYTGEKQYASIMDTDVYTVTQNGGTDVGTYKVTFELKDKDNYVFEESADFCLTLDFEITPADNIWTTPPRFFNSYAGMSVRWEARSRFGEAELYFSDSRDGEFKREAPTKSGVYYAIFKVDGCENYNALVSEPISFTLLEDGVSSVTVTTKPYKTEYSAFEAFLTEGLSVTASYYSGKSEIVDISRLTFTYQQGKSFLFKDNGIIISLGDAHTVLPLTVKRAEYDISDIDFSSFSTVYDGEYHTARIPENLPVGKDGIPLQAKIKGGGSNAGKYTVTLEFTSASDNYLTPEGIGCTLEITPLPITAIWGSTSFVYDGDAKVPTAFYTDKNGSARYLTVLGGVSAAGEDYQAIAIPPSDNYTVLNPTVTFNVAKADYDMSGAFWSGSNFVYDGESKSVTLHGLPDGVTVIGYTDGMATEAGSYKAVAILDYDKNNYHPPEPFSYSWYISPAKYPQNTFTFSEHTEVIFDGATHYPTLSGSMPVGKDGSSPTYLFSKGALHVSEGEISVKITFSTDSKNYLPPESIECTVRILPREITVSWGSSVYTYNGKPYKPVAMSDKCELEVVGEGTDAGVYTAVCTSKNSDYTVKNSVLTFRIDKAKNEWTRLPTASSIYESGAPINSATSLYGISEMEIYTDPSCTVCAPLPLAPGSYYMRFTVREGGNYLSITSEPIPLGVIKVVPVSLDPVFKTTFFKAFDDPMDNISATVTYNDGNIGDVTDMLEVKYENGTALLAGDKRLTLSYQGLSHTADITVLKADYDMSGTSWQGLVQCYDGTYLTPHLEGLPEGVGVVRYEGGAVKAGSYTVRAVLSYDSRNYNAPRIDEVSFVIEKKAVEIPTLSPLEYNGKIQLPTDLGDELTVLSDGFKNSGTYKVTLTLKDTENYSFTGTDSDKVEVDFIIKPRPVFVGASDVLIYKWSKEPEVTLTVTEGGVLQGDTAEFKCVLSGGKVQYVSTNGNYEPIIIGGEVIYLNRPTPAVSAAITLSAILLALLLFAVFIAYLKRDRLLSYIAARKCKRRIQTQKPLLGVVNPYTDDGALPPVPLAAISAFSVEMAHADSLISDSLAKNLVKRESDTVYTEGKRRATVNIDTLSEKFSPGETVDINSLKSKGIVPQDSAYVKVLARGQIDKALTVLANDFSLCAVKMIVLAGGEARRVNTVKLKKSKEKR